MISGDSCQSEFINVFIYDCVHMYDRKVSSLSPYYRVSEHLFSLVLYLTNKQCFNALYRLFQSAYEHQVNIKC